MTALIAMLVIWLVPAVLLLIAALWIITRARLSPSSPHARSIEPNVEEGSNRSADRDAA
jgi:cytochrome c-type biogenesis protein CcmH/NrfF